jgi:Tfp pilus assembly protein PilX
MTRTMNPQNASLLLEDAKRRARRRTASAGGTMFVVAMTLAVLSTLGAWALQSAALEVRMAGYERQSTQTHYLAEYGVVAATQDARSDTMGTLYSYGIYGTPNGLHSSCLSVPCVNYTSSANPTLNPACGELTGTQLQAMGCWRWEMSGIGPYFSPSNNGNLLDSADGGLTGTPGSLGATNTQGSLSIDLTDFYNAGPIKGSSSSSGLCAYWATVTAYGQTQTINPVTGQTLTTSQTQGTEIARARLEVPGTCPQTN